MMPASGFLHANAAGVLLAALYNIHAILNGSNAIDGEADIYCLALEGATQYLSFDDVKALAGEHLASCFVTKI